MTARRGFSLLEVTIAAALAGLMLAASLTASTSIQRSMNNARRWGLLTERRDLLEEYFGPILRQVGQNTIRPWEAVLNPCTSGDCLQQRVHLLELSGDPHLSLKTAWNGTATSIEFNVVNGVCPLTVENGWGGDRSIVIVPQSTSTPPPSATFKPGWATARCTPDPTACTCALSPIPGANDDVDTRANVTTWGFARVAIGQTVSLTRDATANELLMHTDQDRDGTRDNIRLVNDVYGIDLAYGILQLDGSIVFQTTVPVLTFADLRLLRLELAVGARDANATAPGATTLFNGVLTRAKTRLTRSSTVAVLATASAL